MKTLDEIMPILQQLLTLVEQHFGNKCEIVLHDLTKDTTIPLSISETETSPTVPSGAAEAT